MPKSDVCLALYDVLKDATTNGLWRGNPYCTQSIRTAIKTLNTELGKESCYDLPDRKNLENVDDQERLKLATDALELIRTTLVNAYGNSHFHAECAKIATEVLEKIRKDTNESSTV